MEQQVRKTFFRQLPATKQSYNFVSMRNKRKKRLRITREGGERRGNGVWTDSGTHLLVIHPSSKAGVELRATLIWNSRACAHTHAHTHKHNPVFRASVVQHSSVNTQRGKKRASLGWGCSGANCESNTYRGLCISKKHAQAQRMLFYECEGHKHTQFHKLGNKSCCGAVAPEMLVSIQLTDKSLKLKGQ